jgi:hypothetical protein
MFEHFKRYPSNLAIYRYHDRDNLLTSLVRKVVARAW